MFKILISKRTNEISNIPTNFHEWASFLHMQSDMRSSLSFILQIKLCEVEDVDILDKRGYLVVAITPSGREGKIYLRKTEGIRDWYQCLKVMT